MVRKDCYRDIKIKIQCPNCKQIREVQLIQVIKHWLNNGSSGFCFECRKYTSQIRMFERSKKQNATGRLICNNCGKTVICSYVYEMATKRAIKKGEIAFFICPTCGLAERAKNPQKTKSQSVIENSRTKKKDKTIINLFGCQVWPAGDENSFVSPRCKWAEDCEHYDDCVSYIVHNYFKWYGFESDGKGFKKKKIF